MKSKLTIQINNLEALERLIGGDTEVEIDIRQNIVETFTKKHLKTLANDTTMARIGELVKQECGKELLESFEVKNSWGSGTKTEFKLNEKARQLLKESLRYTIDSEIRDIIDEQIELQNSKAKVKEILERATEYIVGDLTKETLAIRLDRMVEAKLKEKLGLK